MIEVLTCVVVEHDLRLVVLAGLFCFASCITAFKLHARSFDAGRLGRLLWVGLTGLAAGSGIWATHFIGMLAYKPSLPVGFEPVGTLLSLVIAAFATSVGFLIFSPTRRVRAILAGLLLGGGIGAMHYSGMAAFRAGGFMVWDQQQVVASMVLGAAFAIASMLTCRDVRSWRQQLSAAALLAVGICALHFTAMSAVSLSPDPASAQQVQLLSRGQMIIGVATLTGFVLAGGLALVGVDVQSRSAHLRHTQLLFDRNPAPMWLLEPGSLRFLRVNDAAIREYGFSREQFLGMTAFDLLAEDERGPARVLSGAPIDYEGERVWKHKRANGAEMLVQPYVRVVPYRRGKAQLVALFDVTARERAAEALAGARNAAEAANQAKSDFLANVSHEIRTPLNGVLGMAQVMEADRLSPAQRRRLDVIRGSGLLLLTLLNDVLDLSKIESGKLELDVTEFDMDELVNEALAMFAKVSEQKGLSFEVTHDDSARGTFRGDRNRIRQVLSNLVSNAVKFTDAGAVGIEVSHHDGALVLRVTDTGLGIAPDKLGVLFEKFIQADPSITRRFGGSGLGLAISRSLVELMDGTIKVDSVEGEGSTFEVTLPLPTVTTASTLDSRRTPVKAARDDASRLRVLAAEDNPVNQLVLKALLGQAAIEPELVADGAQALEAWERGTWDLLLLDVQMPEMDGVSVARAIRSREAQRTGARTPILAVTANAMAHQVAEYRAAGMDGVVVKPINVQQLFDAIETAVAGSSGPDPLAAAA